VIIRESSRLVSAMIQGALLAARASGALQQEERSRAPATRRRDLQDCAVARLANA
jgi:hypothetical protein